MVKVELKDGIGQAFQYLFEALEVCQKVGVKLNDVVQVAQTYFPFESTQNSVHHSLKVSGSIAEAKWHHIKFVQPIRDDKGGRWMTSVCHRDLLVPRLQIQRGEKLSILRGVESVVDVGQRVYVFASDLAQMVVIETESDGTIFLNKDNGRRPRAL